MKSNTENTVLGNYKFIKHISHGSFGEVKVARHLLTGCDVAIKILNRRKIREMDMDVNVDCEIKISKILVHPHIVRLYEVIETATDIYMVMEYVKSGDLFDLIMKKGRVRESEARRIFQQLISGLEYCHECRIVHRDLKPENLLRDANGNVKIADFGLSNCMMDGQFMKTCCGSLNYAAPEVVFGKLYAGPEIDVWSCGVILYALLVGELPFEDVSLANIFQNVKCGNFTIPSHLSPGARDLIARMLVVDPIERITIPEIRQHCWFRVNLPCYLSMPSSEIVDRMRKIDRTVLQQAVEMGFDESFLIQSLQERIHNDATVSYYLLLDKYHRATNYHGENYWKNYASPALQVGESSHSDAGNWIISSRPHTPSGTSGRWNLGFALESGSDPLQIMAAVLGALQNLNACWKKIGQYNIKCRWSPSFNGRSNLGSPLPESSSSNIDMNGGPMTQTVKFELQLYRTSEENKYLVDLQRIIGPHMLFLELCMSFASQLRII